MLDKAPQQQHVALTVHLVILHEETLNGCIREIHQSSISMQQSISLMGWGTETHDTRLQSLEAEEIAASPAASGRLISYLTVPYLTGDSPHLVSDCVPRVALLPWLHCYCLL